MLSPLTIITLDAGKFADVNQADGPRRYELAFAAICGWAQRVRANLRAIGASDAEVSGRVSFSTH